MIGVPDKSTQGFYGLRLGCHLRMSHDHVLTVRRGEDLKLAVTRLTCQRQYRERTAPTPTEDAFSLLHQLGDLDRHACWQGGRQRFAGSFGAGTLSVVDLREQAACEFHGHFDALQFYVPKATLDAFAYENGARSISTLKNDRAVPDAVVLTLSKLLMSAVVNGERANQIFIEQIGLSLVAYFAVAYGQISTVGLEVGALAPWQERRAREILHAYLANPLTIAEVARECRLTPSHFARAFRRSVGRAPHQYLMALRLDRAKDLMGTTELPLADIALLSGFGDQSYFTRAFTRHVGTSPGRWRRMRME